MTLSSRIADLFQQEDLNFLLTNRIPRRAASRFMGWFSRIEQPLVRDISIAVWRFFSGLDLSEAKATRFKSMHDCFIRELRDGARPIDPDLAVLVSPCDGVVGACGTVEGTCLWQIKGFAYALDELLLDPALVEQHRNGRYVTLRLTARMYHRFHAPHDCRVEQVTHVPGDVWNVNAIALKRVARLYCRNERVLIATRLAAGHRVTLVPVAAVLVSGLRLRFLDLERGPLERGPTAFVCNASLRKGEEMGWFEHGSTIIVFAPEGFSLCSNVREGDTIRMGEPLMRLP
jgi:phosphatidylserine decarboxylase